MVRSVNTLTWSDTSEADAPTSIVVIDFNADSLWQFQLSGSYHLQSIFPVGALVDNSLGSVPVLIQVGQTAQSIPAYQSQIVRFPAQSTTALFTSTGTGMATITFYVRNPPGSSIDYLALQKQAATLALPIGMVMPYAGNNAPSLWLFCAGQAISRMTYAALFAVLGTSFGAGDGVATFNIPDLCARLPLGRDGMNGNVTSRVTAGVSGIAANTIGTGGGDQRAQNPNLVVVNNFMSLPILDGGAYVGSGGSSTPAPGVGASFGNLDVSTGFGPSNVTVTSPLAGASQNLPPVLVMNFCIFAGA